MKPSAAVLLIATCLLVPVHSFTINLCQPSPCGPNSECRALNDAPVCSCLPNFVGSPPNCRPECVDSADCHSSKACVNQKCIEKPDTLQKRNDDPCNPSPCADNAECNNGVCTCLPGLQGDPYTICRPECVLNSDCPRDKACIRNKCADPCPGACGLNAQCNVINHIPACICYQGYTGDAFSSCYPTPPVLSNPCIPNPCGPNSQCREINDVAVCSCISGYIGSPPTCQAECIISSDCNSNRACSNQKCIDPCLGACGINSECKVINHNPTCYCRQRYTGNALVHCHSIDDNSTPKIDVEPVNPCLSSPCGPNAECQVIGLNHTCHCLPNFIGNPPSCRPECLSNSDCANHLACVNRHCKNPCESNICGLNGECHVVSHVAICECTEGFFGDPFVQCSSRSKINESYEPCIPSPCGVNAICREQNGVGSCQCLPEYFGNPYDGCRPECVLNSDCTSNKACVRNKCIDPCPGVCGQNADCQVVNHLPVCTCRNGFTGDSYRYCSEIEILPGLEDVCQPNPCGPNSQCRETNGQAICICLPEFVGKPPNCEIFWGEIDDVIFPCSNSTCGPNAVCEGNSRKFSCKCLPDFIGEPPNCNSPAIRIVSVNSSSDLQHIRLLFALDINVKLQNACQSSSCGPNGRCKNINGEAVCECLPNYVGTPPNCRHECDVSSDCPLIKACINQKCKDPCLGACGINSECNVHNHNPICSCPRDYSGDPFVICRPNESENNNSSVKNPCIPSPCGPYSKCEAYDNVNSYTCSCLPGYIGASPNCRPECVISADCPSNKACVRNHCIDPCPGSCGLNALCDVRNHIPVCSCIEGYTGNALLSCNAINLPTTNSSKNSSHDLCNPSPCASNAQCNDGICTCLPGLQGDPYTICRPECVLNSDCPRDKVCFRNKCADPCPGTCGINANCSVINHLPVCTCPIGMEGNAFIQCIPEIEPKVNSCNPSPCGSNTQCREINNVPVCSCLPGFIGSPPNCRPECAISSDCDSNRACFNQKCMDPCPGTCGINSECKVINHSPICQCRSQYTGNPFVYCQKIECESENDCGVGESCKDKKCEKSRGEKIRKIDDFCNPNPCGINALCKPYKNSMMKVPVCECAEGWRGNPLIRCEQTECYADGDCSDSEACVNSKCLDPCIDQCGSGAKCEARHHVAICRCPDGHYGDSLTSCIQLLD